MAMRYSSTSRDTRKYLLYGIVGAILTMIGDCLLLGVDSTGAVGEFDKYAVIAQKLSYTRIGLAGFFGVIGIPLTVFGFYALYLILTDRTSLAARLYRMSLLGYAACGGVTHVICCYLVTGIKKDLECGTENLLMTVVEEQGGYVIPTMIVFLAIYLVSVITMALLIARRQTPLPAWMWMLNPLTFKILINGLGRMGNSAFFNGLACSNMSLGALIIFATWLLALGESRTPRVRFR